MTIKFTRKNIIIAACVALSLVAGTVMYIKSAKDTPASGAYINHSGAEDAKDPVSNDNSRGKSEDVTPADVVAAKIYVDIAGAVNNPGVIEMDAGSRVFQAIEAAGGNLKGADTSVINLAAPLNDGEHIYIPTKSEVANGSYSVQENTTEQPSSIQSSGQQGGNSQGKININTADAAALQQLNGVGPSTAQKIIDYRNSNGKFNSIEQLKNVSGIGDKTFEKLKEHICV